MLLEGTFWSYESFYLKRRLESGMIDTRFNLDGWIRQGSHPVWFALKAANS